MNETDEQEEMEQGFVWYAVNTVEDAILRRIIDPQDLDRIQTAIKSFSTPLFPESTPSPEEDGFPF